MSKSVLGIIPARAGSKGVIGKNKRLIEDIPLIEYTINAAKKSKALTKLVISTDDMDVVKIANLNNVEVIKRPSGISGDTALVEDAVKNCLEQIDIDFDAILLLQPTAPLRSSEDIDSAIELFSESNNRVCSVCLCEDNHPARMYFNKNGVLQSLFPEFSQKRRQDLPNIYHRNGAIYIFTKAHLYDEGIIGSNMTPYKMNIESSINIDSEFDLVLFETLIKNK